MKRFFVTVLFLMTVVFLISCSINSQNNMNVQKEVGSKENVIIDKTKKNPDIVSDKSLADYFKEQSLDWQIEELDIEELNKGKDISKVFFIRNSNADKLFVLSNTIEEEAFFMGIMVYGGEPDFRLPDQRIVLDELTDKKIWNMALDLTGFSVKENKINKIKSFVKNNPKPACKVVSSIIKDNNFYLYLNYRRDDVKTSEFHLSRILVYNNAVLSTINGAFPLLILPSQEEYDTIDLSKVNIRLFDEINPANYAIMGKLVYNVSEFEKDLPPFVYFDEYALDTDSFDVAYIQNEKNRVKVLVPINYTAYEQLQHSQHKFIGTYLPNEKIFVVRLFESAE